MSIDADSLLREQFPDLCGHDSVSLADVISVDGPRSGASVIRELEQLERSLPIERLRPVKAAPAVAAAPEKPATQATLIAQQLEALGGEVRSMELALERERANARQYYDYALAIERRMKDLEKQHSQSSQQLSAASEKETSLQRIRSALSAELARLKGELERYRRAWNEILKRDQDARKALLAWNAQAKRLRELEEQARSSHEQFVAERSRAEAAEMRVTETESHVAESEAKLAEAARRIDESAALAASKERESASLQDLCRAYEQRIQQIEMAAADRLRNTLEHERRALTMEHETRLAAETARMRTEFEFLSTERKKKYEDEVAQLTRERDIGQSTALGRINALEEVVTQDQQELTRMLAARARIEADLRVREVRVDALSTECKILQGVLISEKDRYREIADRVADELVRLEALDSFDPDVLDDLSEASRLEMIATRDDEPALDC